MSAARGSLLIVVALLSAARASAAAEHTKYIPKIIIDTLIQQAFTELNSASDGMPGSDLRRQQAIAAAKKTVSRLRTAAQGDPNQRYILWKTGELESQILLEERDIVLMRLEKRQKESNAVVSVFNTELGKKRPDFTVLKKAIDAMGPIDPKKQRELRSSFDQRRMNISREIVYKLEKALLRSNVEIMQSEFDYCQKNRVWLHVTDAAYNRFETRIREQSEAIKQAPVIDERLALAQHDLSRNSLGAVWAALSDVQAILSRIEHDLPPPTREQFYAKVKQCTAASNKREDSLTAIAYAVCAKSGENAALDYIERVLKPMGVSETKLGETSMSMLRIAASRTKAGDTTLDMDMKAIAREQGTTDDFSQLRSAAKKKAQRRADSVRAVEKENALRRRRQQQRADSIAQEQRQQALQALRANEEKANEVTAQLYTLLEENKAESAYKRFLSMQKPLEKYLVKDAFFLLQETVLQTYLGLLREKNLATAKSSSPPAEKAASQHLAQQSQQDLDKAQKVMSQIYGLIESKNAEAAYRRFCEVRTPLEKYSCPEAFAVLETSVLQSYEAMLQSQPQRR